MSLLPDTLRSVAEADISVGFWCACQCAHNAIIHIPFMENRPLKALDATKQQVRHPSKGNRQVLLYAARDNLDVLREFAGTLGPSSYAAHSVYYVAGGVLSASAERSQPETNSTWFNSTWFIVMAGNASLQSFLSDSSTRSVQKANTGQYEADLERIVLDALWPIQMPDRVSVLNATPALAVAWDQVACMSEDHTDITAGQLIEAHRQCSCANLDWNNPVARAVCERAILMGKDVRALVAPST